MSERPWETSLGETVQEAGTDLGGSGVCCMPSVAGSQGHFHGEERKAERLSSLERGWCGRWAGCSVPMCVQAAPGLSDRN